MGRPGIHEACRSQSYHLSSSFHSVSEAPVVDISPRTIGALALGLILWPVFVLSSQLPLQHAVRT